MALATHVPADWNDILSTTMHKYRDSLTNNVFNSRPLLNFFMSNGRVRTASGGISIVEPLLYGEGEADSYSEWEQLTVTPQNTATAAQFPWRQLFATIAISGLEEAQNNGKEQIINLLEAKVFQSEETLKTRLNGMLFGTYVNDAAKDFFGLPTLVDDTAATGGIDPASEAWWESLVDTAAGVDAAGLEAALRKMYNKTSDAGTDRVDAIFTNDYGFGFYESTLTPQVRYTDTKKANLGFQNLLFKDVPIMWDFQCSGGTEGTVADDSATFYLLNSKYVGMCLHSDRNFKQSPFSDNLSGSVASTASAGVGAVSANALDARVSFITTFGNTTIRNRRRCGKITGVTEA